MTKQKRQPNAWQRLNVLHKGLPRASFNHALKYEPHPGAPGLDIDAIYRKSNDRRTAP